MDNLPPEEKASNNKDVGKKDEAGRVLSPDAQKSSINKISIDKTINVTRLPLPENTPSVARVTKGNDTNQPIIGLSINVPGRKAPIRVKSTAPIVIGRKDRSSNAAPTVDLSADHAAMLGVSRRHVEITLRDNLCYVRDLDSANGAWLNESPLSPEQERPLFNGDQLRLGHLICFIYMIYANSTSELADLDEHVTTIYLADSNLKTRQLRTGLSPHYLISTLGKYLDAVISLQMLINQIHGDVRPDAAIQSFHVDHHKKQMHVEMKNVREIVTFLSQKNYLWQTTVFDASQTDITAHQLALALWKSLDNTPDAQRDHYIDLMSGYFKSFITSDLRLVADSDQDDSKPQSDKTALF